MVHSLTGFGQAERSGDDIKVTAELSSLNGRFFDAHVRLPRWLSHYEARIKELINKEIKRGKVICSITWESESSLAQKLRLNEPVAEMYSQIIRELKEKFSISDEIKLSDLIPLDGLFAPVEDEGDPESEAQLLEEVVTEARKNLQAMRLQEGERLAADMRPRIAAIGGSVGTIRALCRESVEAYREKLENRVKELLNEPSDSEDRIVMEATVVAERCDVTEECVRIESHNEQFLETLDGNGPIGKRLNFILQELNREANTIGSKSASIGISREVVSLKEEIEKLREQVQNIE
jgi:uncharacterized protein (TIGR00255 family)